MIKRQLRETRGGNNKQTHHVRKKNGNVLLRVSILFFKLSKRG